MNPAQTRNDTMFENRNMKIKNKEALIRNEYAFIHLSGLEFSIGISYLFCATLYT